MNGPSMTCSCPDDDYLRVRVCATSCGGASPRSQARMKAQVSSPSRSLGVRLRGFADRGIRSPRPHRPLLRSYRTHRPCRPSTAPGYRLFLTREGLVAGGHLALVNRPSLPKPLPGPLDASPGFAGLGVAPDPVQRPALGGSGRPASRRPCVRARSAASMNVSTRSPTRFWNGGSREVPTRERLLPC